MKDTHTMARRTPGTGSLYQDARGLWRAAINAGYTPAGKRRRIIISGKDDRTVRRKLTQALAEYHTGQLQPSNGTLVKHLTRAWIDTRAHEIRPATFLIEQAACEYINQVLGNKRVSTLKPADLDALGHAIVDDGKTFSTAARYQSVLLRILRVAEKNGVSVPRQILATPKLRPQESNREAIPIEDARKLITHARTRPDGVRWLLALMQGLRQAETLGLTWDAIDFESKTLKVMWQLQSLPYKDKHNHGAGFNLPRGYNHKHLVGAFHLVSPKSRAGVRTVPLTDSLHIMLQDYRVAWEPNPWGLLFTTGKGQPIQKDADARAWRNLQSDAGVYKTKADGTRRGQDFYVLHEARHTTATLLLAAGVEAEIIKAIMGHSDIVTQAQYQHVSAGMALSGLQSAERLLFA